MLFDKKQVFNLLQGVREEFLGLAKMELVRQEDPIGIKEFHMGKEKAFYIAMDVIDDVIRVLQ